MMRKMFFKRKIRFPKQGAEKNKHTLLLLFIVSLLFLLLVRFVPLRKSDAIRENMIQASKIMEDAMDALRDCMSERGLTLDEKNDPNRTGLIGIEYSFLTTTKGDLEAKRTTTNPGFAAVVVFLLKEAGVKRGDSVAVGASSSFPALIVAVMSAAKAMNLDLLMISSLGASQWGANNPDFHWLDMLNCLLESGVFDSWPIGLSLGGEKDRGEDMSPEGNVFLSEEISTTGIPFIQEPDLRANVEARMRLYEKHAAQNPIKAFINIGGSWANMGTDAEILKLKPGRAGIGQLPVLENRGIIYEMASRNIPVIHLLFIRGLIEKYGLSWDPVPLPVPGKEKIFQRPREKQPLFLFISAFYFVFVILILVFRTRLR